MRPLLCAAVLVSNSASVRGPDTARYVDNDVRAGRFRDAIASISRSPLGPGRGGLSLRAQLHMLMGEFNEAATDYRRLATLQPNAGGRATDAEGRATAASELAKLRKRILDLHGKARCSIAYEGFERLLERARAAPDLHLLRGECLFLQRDVVGAHADASQAVSLAPHEPSPWLLLARILYIGGSGDLGANDPSMRCVSRCLVIAPDHKECAAFRKWLATVNASVASATRLAAHRDSHGKSIEVLTAVLEMHEEDVVAGEEPDASMATLLRRVPMPRVMKVTVYGLLCRLSEGLGDGEATIVHCNRFASLRSDGEDDVRLLLRYAWALVWVARVHVSRCSAFDDALDGELRLANAALGGAASTFSRVEEAKKTFVGSLRGVSEELSGLRHLEKMLRNQLDDVRKRTSTNARKLSNLYTVLGIDRSATLAMIKAAYRKLALLFHPDKYAGDDKEHATERFIRIVNAYETLSDAHARKEYDEEKRAERDANANSESAEKTGPNKSAFGAEAQQHEFPPSEHLNDITSPVTARGLRMGWREAWTRTSSGGRERVYVNIRYSSGRREQYRQA